MNRTTPIIISNSRISDNWKLHKAAAQKVADQMAYAAEWANDPEAWNGRVYRMSMCADTLDYKYCPECGSIHLARAWLCRDRLCPVCSWRLSLKRAAEMQRVFLYLSQKTDYNFIPEMLTLTIRNVSAEELNTAIKEMLVAWSTITKRRNVKRGLLGYARSMEITRDKHGRYHPHLHILILRKPAEKIYQANWVDMWMETLNLGYTPVCHIERAYSLKDDGQKDYADISQAAVEALKYAIKADVIKSIPAYDLPGIAAALKGKRLVTYGGIIKIARNALKFNDAEYNDLVEPFSLECPDCGNTAAILMGYKWSIKTGQYFYDGDIAPPPAAAPSSAAVS